MDVWVHLADGTTHRAILTEDGPSPLPACPGASIDFVWASAPYTSSVTSLDIIPLGQ